MCVEISCNDNGNRGIVAIKINESVCYLFDASGTNISTNRWDINGSKDDGSVVRFINQLQCQVRGSFKGQVESGLLSRDSSHSNE